MSKFQILSGYINVGGDRDNVVFRGPDRPITFPEAMLLRIIHGGEDHVHTLIVLNEEERNSDEERQRLAEIYGERMVNSVFPAAMPLPAGNSALPTIEEVEASEKAASEARAAVRQQRASGGKNIRARGKEAAITTDLSGGSVGAEVPALDNLPE